MRTKEALEWEEVDSSNIQATFFFPRLNTICVKFKGGGVYSYMADQEVYMNFRHANSMGSYLNNVLKSFPYTRWESEAALLAY